MMRSFFIGALCAFLISCCPAPRGIVQSCTAKGCVYRTAFVTPVEPKRVAFRPVRAATAVAPKKIATVTTPAIASPRIDVRPAEEKTSPPVIAQPVPPPPVRPPDTADASAAKAATTTVAKTESPTPGQAAEMPEPAQKKSTATPAMNKERPAPDRPADTSVPARVATGTKTEGRAPAHPAETSDPVLKRAKAAIAAKLDDPASAEFDDIKRAVRKDTFGQPIDSICGHVKGKKASGEETGARPFLYVVKEDKAFVDQGDPNSIAAVAYRNICTVRAE